MQQLALLTGDIKHYDWGGVSYIPSLLLIENSQMQPFAEYWLGAHPQAHCIINVANDETQLLRDVIEENKAATLGNAVASKFEQLPYLLKVLDVKDMLSIQVHPSKKQAAIDFEEENKKGVPLTASGRNYKDANHKPELMVAISDFYLLHGFKPEKELIATLEKIKELHVFLPVFKKEGYKGLYRMAMELPQEEVNELLQPIINTIIPLYQQDKLAKDDPHFWAARAALTFVQPNTIDRGIFSIYFFNLLHLKKGEAIFQDAGLPHAYLEGQNVEIMASSDNVLRGGLTTKHIDTAALLKHTNCKATVPKIIKYTTKKEVTYHTPIEDFELQSYRLTKGDQMSITCTSTEIFLLIQGRVTLSTKNENILLKPGNIAAVGFCGVAIQVQATDDALLFKAGVPL